MMIKRHTRPNPAKQIKGGIAERESPIAVSNVMIVCSGLRSGAHRATRWSRPAARPSGRESAASAGLRWIRSKEGLWLPG